METADLPVSIMSNYQEYIVHWHAHRTYGYANRRDGALRFYPGWMRLLFTCVLGR